VGRGEGAGPPNLGPAGNGTKLAARSSPSPPCLLPLVSESGLVDSGRSLVDLRGGGGGVVDFGWREPGVECPPHAHLLPRGSAALRPCPWPSVAPGLSRRIVHPYRVSSVRDGGAGG
jgi:hypothetical protein